MTVLYKQQIIAAAAEGIAMSCCLCHLPYPLLNLVY